MSPTSSMAARKSPYPGEDRIMVPSPKVATYDLQPEMSALELTDKAVEAIESEKYDLIVLNFANPDMVGHTGSLPAAIRAVETVDGCLGRLVAAIDKVGRRASRHRRPRQLRGHARSRHRPAAHSSHDEPGTRDPAWRSWRKHRGRTPGRPRADASGAYGAGPAGGDDGHVADPVSEACCTVACPLPKSGEKPDKPWILPLKRLYLMHLSAHDSGKITSASQHPTCESIS